MNAQLRGPGDFSQDDDDDRIESRAEELAAQFAADPVKLAGIDNDASETLDGSQYEAMFAVLADLHAVDASDLPGHGILPRLYRLARELAAVRTAAIADVAREQAALEARDWPVWLGTQQATQFHAHLRGEP